MPPIEKRKILVVDDDPMFLMTIKGLITSAGYLFDSAMNGKEALEKVGKSPPHLIIVDVIMREMNGFELTRAIRALNKTVPIIMLTGMRADSDKFEAKMAGANEYLNKPVNPDDLFRRIRSLVGSTVR
jgi:DNA-binding response OmpR family regulator